MVNRYYVQYQFIRHTFYGKTVILKTLKSIFLEINEDISSKKIQKKTQKLTPDYEGQTGNGGSFGKKKLKISCETLGRKQLFFIG